MSIDNAIAEAIAIATAPLVREVATLRRELAMFIKRNDRTPWISVPDYVRRHAGKGVTLGQVRCACDDERLDPPPEGHGRLRRVHPDARILPPGTKRAAADELRLIA